MLPYECAVIGCGTGESLHRRAVAALRDHFELRLVGATEDAAAALGRSADLCVLCVEPAATLAAVQMIHRLRAYKATRPIVVLLTAATSESDLHALICAGAADFALAPFDSVELVTRVVRVAGALRAPESSESSAWPAPIREPTLQTRNLRLRKLLAQVPALAGSDVDVLVTGEQGTGRRPLIAALVRLAGVQVESVIDTERDTPGAIETTLVQCAQRVDALPADRPRPVLIVHDMERLSAVAQSAVLHVMVRRGAGGVRVWASAAQDLQALVEAGRLNPALHAQLKRHRLALPPLRERCEDIVALASWFVAQACAATQRVPPALSPACCARLMQHDWPGNMRELRQVARRAVLSAPAEVIGAADLHFDSETWPPLEEGSLQQIKQRVVISFERTFLEQLLAACCGNIAHAARRAGKNRRALFGLLRKHDIDADAYRPGPATLNPALTAPRAESPQQAYAA
jgi:two-component system response regulator GlrR